MVVKKSNIISIAMILGLMMSPDVFANDSNNLVQLDLKRASDNSVDVTLVTSDNYGDNVMVRKKSDTKYVILIPKVQSSGYRASNLSGLNDLVSNIDVKTVDDTSGGYTKVTLITTRPLDIKTRTQKSAATSAERKEYNTLMAQANAIKNNVSKREPQKPVQQKTEVTVNKTPAIVNNAKPQQNISKQSKPKIELTEITPEKIEKQAKRPAKTNLISSAKQDKALEELPEALPEIPPVLQSENNQSASAKTDIEPIENISNRTTKIKQSIKSALSSVATGFHKATERIPSKLPKALGVGLIAFAVITALAKLFGKSRLEYANSNPAQSFIDGISDAHSPLENQTYDDYVTSKDLTWREKYKLYLDKSAQPVKRANKKGYYSFIKTPNKAAIEQKRNELEKLVTPPSNINSNIEPEIVEVHSEDSAIAKTVKFKAFSNKNNSLRMTNRSRSRFKGYEKEIPLHELPTLELNDSPLTISNRSLSGANLKVSDVDKRKITYEPKEYIMSSVDEYLSILDHEKEDNLIKENSYSNLPEISAKKENMSSPVKAEKPSYLKGAIVKSGYKISPEKGIYMINKNGKNTIIGKVNDKMFVLKKFDGVVTDPIQVRHDNANVYMVKAGKFKSLVEVNDDKMGVLIEL